MKKQNKEFSGKNSISKKGAELCGIQSEQQQVQKRYHSEFEKYQEQISKTKLSAKTGEHAA